MILHFFRFQRVLNDSSINTHVTNAYVLSYQFCIKLPQHLYNVDNNTAQPVTATVGPTQSSTTTWSLGSFFSTSNLAVTIPPTTLDQSPTAP